MALNYFGKSDIGKVQKVMDDAFVGFTVNDNILFIAVADGLGAKKGLDSASAVAMQEFKKYMTEHIISDDISHIESEMKKCLYMINRIIYNYQRIYPEVYNNFSTTFTVVALNYKKEIVIAHTGNSRFLLFRQGEMYAMTRDDTIAQDLVDNNEIQAVEYPQHPDRNKLTKSLGMNNFEPFTTRGNLMTNDVIVLVTNGIFELLSNEKLAQIIMNTESTEEAVEWIIDGANDLGGFDNMASVISFIDF
ncbi:MAG: PP2C family protein-serine/threonine phosphatase [bacterium]